MKMKRDIHSLSNKEYDLVIIGCGIFGACAAWDAVLRGLSVAVIDKGDFSHATSANHLKMVHGGIRYLQHGDVIRIRESCKERSALLRVAPHLVKPLPIVMPTYGHGMKGKAVLGTGMLLYDLLTLGRNRGVKPDRTIPWGKFMSKDRVLELFPGIKPEGLTGAGIFCDGQMYNPPRIALSFLRSAVERGVHAANYVEATGFIKKNGKVKGIHAEDKLLGHSFDIRARCVLNAAGPWAHRLLESGLNVHLPSRPTFSRDLAFVVKRKLSHGYGLAFSTGSKDSDSIVDRGGRHLFAAPWRDHILIGVWHKVYTAPPDNIAVETKEIKSFVDEVNRAYPGIDIGLDEISLINTGLTLFGEEGNQSSDTISFGKRSILTDHGQTHNIDGLVTIIGVRATTARGIASKAINLIAHKLNAPNKISDTENTTIYGGDIESVDAEVQKILQQHGSHISARQANSLAANYGSQWPKVIAYAAQDSSLYAPIGDSATLKAEVIHAVREEMALRLSDVVFRRTDMGTGQLPDQEQLETCARLMANDLKWDQETVNNEIKSIKNTFHTVGRNPH